MGNSKRQRSSGARVVLAVGVALLVVLSLSSVAGTTPVGERTHRLAGGQSGGIQQTTTQSGSEFNLTVFKDVAGQIATEDATVAVRGTATGTDAVLVALFDRRGRVATELLSVNDSDVFEEEDLQLVTDDGTPLAEGLVVATVLSPGRDGLVGDGEVSGRNRVGIADFEAGFHTVSRQQVGNRTVSRTQRQLVELFYDQTVEDSGSDDLLLAEEFVYTDGRTSIERVVPQSRVGESADRTGPEAIRVGDTMVVRGLTNRRPDDNTIFVEAIDGPSAAAFDLAATDTWGTDGVWQVELDTEGVEPGTYTVQADDGETTDSFRVRILPRANESAGNSTASDLSSRLSTRR